MHRALHVALDDGAERALVPARAALRNDDAMGGPFIPLSGSEAALLRLSETLQRLDQLERTVLSLPSVRPAEPVVLSSTFGVRSDPFNHRAAMHAGLDIKGQYGQPIYAAAAGRVSRVGQMAGYGNVVMVDHGNGIETRYGHLSSIIATPGTRVKRGQLIGLMGSTGRSTGSHLHYEVRLDGRAVNPTPFLRTDGYLLAMERRSAGNVALGGPAKAD